jgi:hypothetical protein
MTKGTQGMVIATQLEARPKFKIHLAHTYEAELFGPEYLALDQQTTSSRRCVPDLRGIL